MASSDYPCPPDMVDTTAMFVPTTLYPTYPSQSGSLSPDEGPQWQQWPGLDDYTVEPIYAEDELADVANPSHFEAGTTQNLESSYLGMESSHLGIGAMCPAATWASHENNWLPFQYGNFQQPLVSLVNTHRKGEAWPAPSTPSQPEPRPRAKKATITTRTNSNAKSCTIPSVTTESRKRAKIGAVSKPSPSSSDSHDNQVTTTTDSGREYQGEVDEAAEQSESWPPGSSKKYRVKNRAAAKRCREKTKQYEEDLAVQEKEITQERMYLDACVTALKNEVLTLKNQILQHSDCGCELIEGYIARAAGGISAAAAAPPGPQEYQSI